MPTSIRWINFDATIKFYGKLSLVQSWKFYYRNENIANFERLKLVCLVLTQFCSTSFSQFVMCGWRSVMFCGLKSIKRVQHTAVWTALRSILLNKIKIHWINLNCQSEKVQKKDLNSKNSKTFEINTIKECNQRLYIKCRCKTSKTTLEIENKRKKIPWKWFQYRWLCCLCGFPSWFRSKPATKCSISA